MNLRHKAEPLKAGYNRIMGPPEYPLKHLKMGQILLTRQHPAYAEDSAADEIALIMVAGQCQVSVEGEKTSDNVGGRNSMLSGAPTAVYIPRNRKWRISTTTASAQSVVFRATARRDTAPAVVRSEDVKTIMIGTDTWERQAAMVIADNIDADRLIVGETYNLPGRWSSYPPHKHDINAPPNEAWYEEIYHYAVEPRQGFGIQRVYTAPDYPDPFDEVLIVEDGDTVALPRGYHPIVAAAGYRLGYIWALAGDERQFGAWSRDPKHAWILDLESNGRC
jgi:5-deoxy-glucuronate isomerase